MDRIWIEVEEVNRFGIEVDFNSWKGPQLRQFAHVFLRETDIAVEKGQFTGEEKSKGWPRKTWLGKPEDMRRMREIIMKLWIVANGKQLEWSFKIVVVIHCYYKLETRNDNNTFFNYDKHQLHWKTNCQNIFLYQWVSFSLSVRMYECTLEESNNTC